MLNIRRLSKYQSYWPESHGRANRWTWSGWLKMGTFQCWFGKIQLSTHWCLAVAAIVRHKLSRIWQNVLQLWIESYCRSKGWELPHFWICWYSRSQCLCKTTQGRVSKIQFSFESTIPIGWGRHRIRIILKTQSKSTIGKSDYKFRIPRAPKDWFLFNNDSFTWLIYMSHKLRLIIYDSICKMEISCKLKGLNDSYRSNNMGEVGFGFNGVAIFNPYDRYCCDAGLYELRKIFRFLVPPREFKKYIFLTNYRKK